MPKFKRSEVEEAFGHQYAVGAVGEDWQAWTKLFIPDLYYEDYFWGPLHTREELELWIHAVMKGVPEIYTVLNWYAIDDDKVTFHMENRRDNPDPDEGPPYFDFTGISVLWYAGDGLWAREEDLWDRTGARNTSIEYVAACERAGADTPESRMTRNHWPDGPDFAKTDAEPEPSWLEHPEVPAIQSARKWKELLATIRP
jgi:hypothetical protein